MVASIGGATTVDIVVVSIAGPTTDIVMGSIGEATNGQPMHR